jgi:hypothetical protein
VAIRLLLLRLPRLWYDEATSGLLGLSVLRGELPVYFFGQPFMGALDGYLAAPLFWLLGPSARDARAPARFSSRWPLSGSPCAWPTTPSGARAALFTAAAPGAARRTSSCSGRTRRAITTR